MATYEFCEFFGYFNFDSAKSATPPEDYENKYSRFDYPEKPFPKKLSVKYCEYLTANEQTLSSLKTVDELKKSTFFFKHPHINFAKAPDYYSIKSEIKDPYFPQKDEN